MLELKLNHVSKRGPWSLKFNFLSTVTPSIFMLSVVYNIMPSTDTSSFKSVLSRDDISIDWNFTRFASREFSLNHFRGAFMSEVKVFFQSVPHCCLHRKGNCYQHNWKGVHWNREKMSFIIILNRSGPNIWTLWNTHWNRIPFTPGRVEFDSLVSIEQITSN